DTADVSDQSWHKIVDITENGEVPLTVTVSVPDEVNTSYYRTRITLKWNDGKDKTAKSMGHFDKDKWQEILDKRGSNPDENTTEFYIPEAGFSAVPRGFKTVKEPNKVPDFGDFTTPVIRPGESGKYEFTVTNRYDKKITNVNVTVEFYMWATIEDAKPIDKIDGPPPKVKATGDISFTKGPFDLENKDASLEDKSSDIIITITTKEDTPKGTYFVRHRIEFVYENETFIMASRGFFTREQWEGFDYSNLWYQLEVAGIVPDSSFSVKDPVPLWPLATLIVLCVLFGALAVVFYLAEEHGDQYPRLKKGLQFRTGRWEQRKRLMQQRMDELRGEDWEKGDDGDVEDVGDAEGT
ncbi:MAG: hypothetical protein LN414_06290, partial [Candidatus Thermoplasmatota archaeon]|nr:hypothetical protein [Candidatus Thermoplasmatota archaeon]